MEDYISKKKNEEMDIFFGKLHRLYNIEKKSMRDCGKILEISLTALYYRCLKHGFKTRTRSEALKVRHNRFRQSYSRNKKISEKALARWKIYKEAKRICEEKKIQLGENE